MGHPTQLCAVEEVRLVGGKGDGMRLLQVRNATGLEFTVAADRCADIYRLLCKGCNMGYFSPTGYVAPAYYDDQGAGFLKSFTAGFLTTCGLTAAGAACEDDGESLGLHGSIGNTPCERIWWTEDAEHFYIHAEVDDSRIFASKMHLSRLITCGKFENYITIEDTVENRGDAVSPVMILYHMNMGYPLLSENSVVEIPSEKVTPRNDHAAEDLDTWHKMLPPTANFEEQCYFHSFSDKGFASIYNPDINKGLAMRYDAKTLGYFTEWKMMGYRDYVLGLEPGNCTPDGRDVMRREGKLKFLKPGEGVAYEITVQLYEK
jgi:hypothetical protein